MPAAPQRRARLFTPAEALACRPTHSTVFQVNLALAVVTECYTQSVSFEAAALEARPSAHRCSVRSQHMCRSDSKRKPCRCRPAWPGKLRRWAEVEVGRDTHMRRRATSSAACRLRPVGMVLVRSHEQR